MKTGWEIKRLGDIVVRLTNGYVGPTRDIYLESGVPYLLARHVKNNQLTFDGKTFISDEFNHKNKKSMLKAGDVLLVQSGHIGHSAVVTDEHEGHNCHAMIVITPIKDMVSGHFLSLFFNSPEMQSGFENIRSGSTVPHLTCKEVKEIAVPLPPLPEQQRIVGILDEAFEGIATAKANAEKNLLNARALFDSHLQSVFTQRGEGWVDQQLSSLCHEITVGHVGSMASKYKESGVPFLRSQNIRPFAVSLDNVVFIDEEFHISLKKSRLRPGDLAIVRTGYPGTAAVIPPDLPDSNCSDLVIVRPSKEVNPHFLAAFFNSAFGKQLVLGKIVGAAQKHFNVTAAKEVMLHVPPMPEQLDIINRIDLFREETQHLESIYQQKLAALDALKKSLLDQAFTGAL